MTYNPRVDALQTTEYPMLEGKAYLDHGGATIYAKSLIDRFAADLVQNLYGNPHSASTPAMLSGQVVEETREKTLRFFGADPEHFHLIFTQNATAAVKIVMDSFKDIGVTNNTETQSIGGFWYGYHVDSHNSIVGVRETADDDHHCFQHDAEVEHWISGTTSDNRKSRLGLFAYPAQSNFNGRRLPLKWAGELRNSLNPAHHDTYTLLDAAAYATTAPLNKVFADSATAPDFTVVSFYKIFGFPDLGALIVRRESGGILQWGRKYFGGGTVSMVTVLGNKPFHHFKARLHSSLEDGTLPFHNILALSVAISTHTDIYGPDPMTTISKHTSFLGKYLFDAMSSLNHANGLPVCHIYADTDSTYDDPSTQGSTVAFNIIQPNGTYAPYTSVVENLANKRQIFVRSGQLCNPGGVATRLGWETWRLKRLWADGYRCGEQIIELVKGRPTGVVRVSLGAMTTIANIDALIRFLMEEFMVLPLLQTPTSARLTANRMLHKNKPSTSRSTHKPLHTLPAQKVAIPMPASTPSAGSLLLCSTTLQQDSTSSLSGRELPADVVVSQISPDHKPILVPLLQPNSYKERMGQDSFGGSGYGSFDFAVQANGKNPRADTRAVTDASAGMGVRRKVFSEYPLRKVKRFVGAMGEL